MSNPTRPVTGQVIDTAWGLAVADAVVRVYPNAATRDADLAGISAAELLGQACVLTDTGSLLVYASATLGWRPPWNTAWGSVTSPVTSSLDVTGTASFQTVLSTIPTFNVVAGRTYLVHGELTYVATAPGQFWTQFAGGTGIHRIPVTPASGGESSVVAIHTQMNGTSTIGTTANIGIVGVGANARGSLGLHRLTVEDVGPYANPAALRLQPDTGMPEVDPDLLDLDYRDAWLDQQATQALLDVEAGAE